MLRINSGNFYFSLQSYGTFDEKNEKAYITRVATNKCLDHLKRAERRTMPSEDEELERGSPPVDSAEKQVMEIVVMEQLEKCCNRLKEPYKNRCL